MQYPCFIIPASLFPSVRGSFVDRSVNRYSRQTIIFVQQPMFSQKSLDNYRSEIVQQRVSKVTRDLLLPSSKVKRSSNLYKITSNTSACSVKTPALKSQNQLQKRINMLQNELKRKLTEDSIMRHLFKTKTPSELTHIDLYLQIRRLQDRANQLTQCSQDYNTKVEQFEEELKRKEQQHLENVQEINECLTVKENEWFQEKLRLVDQVNRLKQAYQNCRFLLQEMKKKNAQLLGRNKQIIQQANIEKDALNLTIIKLKADYQSNVIQLKKAASLSRSSNDELHHLQQTVRQLNEDLQAYKDQKQRLEMKLEDLSQVNQELTHKFAANQKEEQQKFNVHYQKLRKDYEIQIQTLISGHQQLMKNERKENLELRQKIKAVSEQKLILKSDFAERQKQQLQKDQNMHHLEKIISQLNIEKEKLIEMNSKLARQLKQAKFDSKQSFQAIERTKFELNDLKVAIEKLNKQISELQQQNMIMSNKNNELKRQVQYSQSYQKLNDKVYNENYKTLGRIIEINHKIKHQLALDSQIASKVINEQSLNEVVSHLTELLQQYTSIMSKEKKSKQQNARERNIQNRQIVSVLQHCKNYIHNENAQSLISKYITILKERKQSSSQQNHERTDVYHQLIECLMEVHNLKFYSQDNTNQPTIQKDSLDSIYVLKNVQSSNKFTKHATIQRQSSGKIRNRHKIEAESSVYDMPLRRKLLVDQQDKQNVNVNIAKSQEVGKRDPNKKYLNEVRDRLSNKMSEKCKEKEDLRSQVLKKYFRS